ncbi:hypothetical protein [Chitinophaga sp. YIM B06452]|uniref:hypothetical protein n=1 Tax=Chitinophaga sp. YIM B06452 TaxID=3082158 RepID=UPI0031FEF73C
MITILVHELGFIPGSNRLWVAAKSGKILMEVFSNVSIEIGETRCENPVCHADMVTSEDIEILLQQPGCWEGTKDQRNDEIIIPAGAIEFSPIGNTIWVQSPIGATILRIKSKNSIKLTDPLLEELDGEDERFYCSIHVDQVIDICLVESIAAKYNLL